ncbi:phosphatidylglycerophosphatase A [Botrimarina sp.]|uniref:phosphatidylglycerophosphatase A family protein n=1 Tax=Botrimarina sp. TaxID=2795802 RepID=UPI0032F028CC
MDSPVKKRISPLTAPAAWLATGLGVTARSPAPGTIGALWGVPIWAAIAQLPWHSAQLAAVGLLIVLGAPLCDRAARELVDLGLAADAKDPQAITWDEFTTVPLVYAFAPEAGLSVVWLVVGFAWHRVFDITKPWPCRPLERLPDGAGVMADDAMAALYAGLAYAGCWRLFGT